MGKIFGGSKPKKPAGPSPEEIRQKAEAEQRQKDELAKLKSEEESRTNALKRKRRGRASLISGEETGLSETLGA